MCVCSSVRIVTKLRAGGLGFWVCLPTRDRGLVYSITSAPNQLPIERVSGTVFPRFTMGRGWVCGKGQRRFSLASLARLVSVLPCIRREVDEKCILLDHYAASTDNYLPTLRDNQSVQE